MTVATDPPAAAPVRRQSWLVGAALSPRFHWLVERIPFVNRLTRREGRALFDIVSGFVQSQTLVALVDLGLLDRLAQGPAGLAQLAQASAVSPDRLAILLQAGAALGLVRQHHGQWALTTRGAAFLAVPGLASMVRHHRALYDDLADPAAFFRGGQETALARFWPYVFGAGVPIDTGLAARFSTLMAESQTLVAEDTLRQIDLSGTRHLMDVGGGTGAFLGAVARAYPQLQMTLFDLPEVVAAAPLALGPIAPRVAIHPGSFRTDPLPKGPDAISLVRVLYDHSDATVDGLFASVAAALPKGGRLIISEPMSGGANPDPATDVYYAIYTLAMQTGRTRAPEEIAARLAAAGFVNITRPKSLRPFITSVITAERA